MDLSQDEGLTGKDLSMSPDSKSKLHEIGHMVFLDAYRVSEVDNTKGYVDLRHLGLQWPPISAKDVNLHIATKSKQINHARVQKLDIPFDFRMGDKNIFYMYFRNVEGVDGDFNGNSTMCSNLEYADDIIQVDVQVYKP